VCLINIIFSFVCSYLEKVRTHCCSYMFSCYLFYLYNAMLSL
jgi:hypothetical protein